MTLHKILYSDNRGVRITDSTLEVKKNSLELKGIKKYRLSTKKPDRIAETISFFIGLPLAVCGLLNIISPADIPYIKIKDVYYNPNDIALWAGIVYIVIGLLPVFIDRKSYALRITTPEGKKNILVSRNKEYILKIMEALNNAFITKKKNTIGRPRKQKLVS